MEPRMEDTDRFDAYERRFSGFMVGGMVMLAGAAFLSGPLAIAACAIGGGTLFGLAAYTFFESNQADGYMPPSPPKRKPGVQHQAITLEAEAATSVRPWRDRVEQDAGTFRRDDAGLLTPERSIGSAPAADATIDSWAEAVQKYAAVNGEAGVHATNGKLSR